MMKRFDFPKRDKWGALCKRPAFERKELTDTVRKILDTVKKEKDTALLRFTESFDKTSLDSLAVTKKEYDAASDLLSFKLKSAIELAKNNIEKFHASQTFREAPIETSPGVRCWRKAIPIEKVGLYIPGGSAPLFSTILMLGIPAKIAGCKEIILCTPPGKDGKIHPAILYTAQRIGIENIFKVGGAQAVAAMAYGTETIPRVYKIFGPGNQYVTKAKELVQQEGIAIDMPAGPSEVLIIADRSGVPQYIAADLLSQAEHGSDSQVMLLANDAEIIKRTQLELKKQLERLPRKEIATKALKNSKAILLKDIDTCMDFSNLYAPEHLIIASEKANAYIDKVLNAGSVFIGNYSCESAGDYASGTNHTLPTNAYARNYSGVSVDSFIKKITFQEISEEGIKNIGPAIELMAEAEALIAHKNAVSFRLQNSKKPFKNQTEK